MASQETFEKLVYEFQYLRGFSDSIQQRIEMINATVGEIQIATATLEGIGNEEPGSSMLVPIGGGSYVWAKLDNREKIIVGVGADVAVEKTIAAAKEDFQARILELEKAQTVLQKQFDEISTKMNGLQREIQKITQQPSGKTEDVRGP